MCGRGACTLSAERCRRVSGGARVRGLERLRPRYNLTPRCNVPVIRTRAPQKSGEGPEGGGAAGREVCAMRWGLVPSFAKRAEDYDAFSGGSSTFNARVESVQTSGLWRRLVDSRRAVMLFDGFYEWRKEGKAKVPMFIRNRDDYDGHVIAGGGPAEAPAEEADAGPRQAPLLLAALYDVWKGPKEGAEGAAGAAPEEPLESATILTMDSAGTPLFKVHDRMPVFLTPATAALWLDPAKSFSEVVAPVLKASEARAQGLFMYEVSPLVSSVKNESPDCILPKKEMDMRSLSGGLGRFFKKVEPGAPKPAPLLASDAPEAASGAKRPAEPPPGLRGPEPKVARIEIEIDD